MVDLGEQNNRPQRYVDFRTIGVPVVLLFAIVLAVSTTFYEIGTRWQNVIDRLGAMEATISEIRVLVGGGCIPSSVAAKKP